MRFSLKEWGEKNTTMSSIVPATNRKRIVIVGGGFGGIVLAKSLKKSAYQVVLLDKNNYHTFQPLLYQVATGGLEPDSIAFPLRKIFGRQENFFFRMAEVQAVDLAAKSLATSLGPLSYDFLVLATGSRSTFYGMDALEAHAFGMKTVPEAMDIRSLILNNLECSLLSGPNGDRDRLMKFIVVGGGPTGVETAGALAELKRHVLPSDYPELDLRQMEVHLIEAGDQLLAGMSPNASREAQKALEKLGVHIWLNTFVKDYDGQRVRTQTGKSFDTGLVLWAAGIEGSVIPGIPDSLKHKGGRLKVDDYNRLEGYEEVFALGDLAWMATEDFPNGLPQVAPVAIQHARNIAANFKKMYAGKPLQPFSYTDKGAMATIGRNKAVVDIKGFHLKGFFAWLVWMQVHLVFLMGFRNKLVVFINWVWNYLTYDRGNRLILRPFKNRPTFSQKAVTTEERMHSGT